MILPATYDMRCLRGGTFTQQFTLYQDAAQTQLFDLTGYTCSLLGVPQGAGDTVVGGGTAGTVTVTLQAANTALLAEATYHYVIEIVNGQTVLFPVRGSLLVEQP